MAELHPYEPSWRDQLGQLPMGDERVLPLRRRFVSSLLGSADSEQDTKKWEPVFRIDPALGRPACSSST
ncbi:hypothetical protein CYD53_10558 [Bosea psychrotolerans]|uniref:Uncharacterized protein n=1 Tax=Bosea psychrotolerans TaxID=1871628 RepID=A0A2S4MCC6_9HYPH|nr:hypothetical protein CYD53_10558 [Bosea psychrotolerans]